MGGVGLSAYLSLIGRRRGLALIRGWALINFFCFQDGRLFEVGANSRLGVYSNNGMVFCDLGRFAFLFPHCVELFVV